MLSIIIPVYNVEEYLPRCVESIVKQTLRDFEVILVDDGSTDSSGKMCDEYALKDSRIRVIHKENGGLTSAWTTGAKAAAGDYFGFVDSDDWIDEDMYQRMYEKAKQYSADLVLCGLVKEFENGTMENRRLIDELPKEYYEEEEICKEIYPVFINNGAFDSRAIPASRAMKLYRSELILENIRYCNDKVSIGEDMVITFAAFLDAKKIYAIHDYYPYHYWINQKSLTGKHDPGYLDRLLILKQQLDFINREKAMKKQPEAYDFTMQIRNDFLFLVMMCIKEEVSKNHVDKYTDVIRNIRKICEQKEVKEALAYYQMPKMMLSGKVFLFLMKAKCYRICHLLIKIAFPS